MSDIDLDQQPKANDAPHVLSAPKRAAATVAVVGAVVIAIAALTVPTFAFDEPQPVASPVIKCAPVTAPLPAFVIDQPVAGNVDVHEDSGEWSWRQAIWIPESLGSRPGTQLAELQQGDAGRLSLVVVGANEIGLHIERNGQAGQIPAALVTFGTWTSLQITSTDGPQLDTLRLTSEHETQSGTAEGLHAPLSGFSLSTPLGQTTESVRFGPPGFALTATC